MVVMLKPQYVNSLWPSDAIWWHRSGSTLAQVMACCLTAPSHYLNQCWLIINEVQWHSYLSNFTTNASTISHWNLFEKCMSKISFKSFRGHWVNHAIPLAESMTWHQIEAIVLKKGCYGFYDIMLPCTILSISNYFLKLTTYCKFNQDLCGYSERHELVTEGW